MDSQFRQADVTLTKSEEALVDFREDVIQIIDPGDNSNDEEAEHLSFSLYGEETNNNFKGEVCKKVSDSNCLNETDSLRFLRFSFSKGAYYIYNGFATVLFGVFFFSETDVFPKKNIYSGMTTIGPMKDIDHDPKDVSFLDIDYGKMTRITSSRQLANNDFFGTELRSPASLKLIENDEDSSITVEGNRLESSTLINRDIASLTKVQKVKEVMSYHPKPDEDFEEESNLNLSRLDLKNVESMTDERYKAQG